MPLGRTTVRSAGTPKPVISSRTTAEVQTASVVWRATTAR
jgi:hypothetical protein